MRTVLVVEHEAGASLDLMASTLGSAVEVVRPYRGEPLPDPDVASSGRFGGLLVLGGEMAAWEDDVAPWLPATRALLAAAVRARLPTLGVCLGAQLLAKATGGRAERGAAGLEIGAVEFRPLPAAVGDPLLPAGPVSALTYHQDAVTQLPPDAELLATGDAYPVQAFRVGECAWGVQYHPEVSVAGFERWLTGLPPDHPDADGLRASVRDCQAAQQQLARGHAAGLARRAGLGLPS